MIPAYRRIINDLTEKIRTAYYREGEKLPSESQLTEEFSTSRITVTRALKELELTGLIYKIKGKGSFVSENTVVRNKIISLVIPHKADFFSGGQQYIRSIYKYCKRAGYLCSVHYSEQSSKREREILEELMNFNVAGVILYPINNNNIDAISRLLIEDFPIILLDRKLEELDIPVVESDNLKGAYDAVQYMIEMGHNRIAFIGEIDSYSANERYKGYCRALFENKIAINRNLVFSKYGEVQQGENQHILNQENASLIVDRIINQPDQISSLFCINDYVAFRITEAIENCGLKIPEDYSICGFDNLHYFPEMSLNLVTVEQDFNKIGKTSVELLISLINDGKNIPPDNIVKTKLIKGKSVRKL